MELSLHHQRLGQLSCRDFGPAFKPQLCHRVLMAVQGQGMADH